MPPLKSAGAAARAASRRRASAREKSTTRRKPARKQPVPRTNSAHYKPAKPRRKAGRKLNATRSPLPIQQPPPPREADPLARQTGRRRVYYTDEFLAEAKRRVEQTTQSTNAIAADFGMDHGPLWRLIERYGWVRPEGALRRPRGLSPVMRLAAQVDALVAAGSAHSRDPSTPRGFDGLGPQSAEASAKAESGNPEPSAQKELGPRWSLPSGGPEARPGGGDERAEEPPASDDAIERFEAAVLKELGTVEAMRADLGKEPQRPIDAERTARTLSVLTDTIAKLRRLRMAGQPQPDKPHDDMPADIDEFRNEFARRIRALVASRTGGGGTGGD